MKRFIVLAFGLLLFVSCWGSDNSGSSGDDITNITGSYYSNSLWNLWKISGHKSYTGSTDSDMAYNSPSQVWVEELFTCNVDPDSAAIYYFSSDALIEYYVKAEKDGITYNAESTYYYCGESMGYEVTGNAITYTNMQYSDNYTIFTEFDENTLTETVYYYSDEDLIWYKYIYTYSRINKFSFNTIEICPDEDSGVTYWVFSCSSSNDKFLRRPFIKRQHFSNRKITY
jgi:hypothetical protein